MEQKMGITWYETISPLPTSGKTKEGCKEDR